MPTPAPHLHALAITLLVLGLIGVLRLITFDIHFFDPFNNGIQDYEVTDIFFSQLRDPKRVRPEDRIVLVHVDHPERAEIAGLIDRIASRRPAAIGVDILFPGRKDPRGDSLLAASLSRHPEVILAANLAPYDEERDGIPGLTVSDSLFSRHGRNAYTNFLAGTDRTVRLFTPRLRTLDGQTQTAFSVSLAAELAPERVRRLLWRRGERPVRINYRGDYRSFPRVNGYDLLEAGDEALAIFRDRIAIIGFIDSRAADAPIEDRYFTPLNPVYTGRSLPDMYGAVIHANIVSMILDGSYIFELPGWLEGLLIFGFTYANVYLIHRMYHKLPDSYHGVTRILQLVELFGFFFLTAVLFHYFRLKLDFAVGLLALLLAYDIVMIYESFLRKRIPYLSRPTP
jgi:CHASE2 domain-containing sensor protein